jgi:hypothetical protein
MFFEIYNFLRKSTVPGNFRISFSHPHTNGRRGVLGRGGRGSVLPGDGKDVRDHHEVREECIYAKEVNRGGV